MPSIMLRGAIGRLILITCFLVRDGRAVTGVDVSQPVSQSTFSCLMQPGGQGPVDFAIVRVYQSSGHIDPNGASTIKASHAAGIKNVDGYIFPCYSCGDAAGQVKATVQGLNSAGAKFGMLWYDIEKYHWSSDKAANQGFIKEMIDEGKALGIHAGIYSSRYGWEDIVGTWSYAADASLPLWYAHYDGKAAFSDFEAFGGWSSPAIKQYLGDKTSCGVGIDYNYYPSGSSIAVPVAPSPPSFAPSWCKGANPQFAPLPWSLYNGGKISPQFKQPAQIGFKFDPRLHQQSGVLSLSESVGWNANLFMTATGDYTCEKTCQTINGQKVCGVYQDGECNMQCDASVGAQCGNCMEIDIFETFTPGYFISTSHVSRTTDANGMHTAFWHNTAQPACAGTLPPTLGGARLPFRNYSWEGTSPISGELTFEPDHTDGTLKIYLSVQSSDRLLIFADSQPAKSNGDWLPGWDGCNQGSTSSTNVGNGYRGWSCGLSFMSSVWTGGGGYKGNSWGVPDGVDDSSCPWRADQLSPPPNIQSTDAQQDATKLLHIVEAK